MTEEQIERLKNNLRTYTLSYDWWGQSGYNYVKKMFADNKEEWVKVLQKEWNNRPWWLYETEELSIFTKFMCVISRYIPRNGTLFVKDYLYDINEQLINIENIENYEPYGLDENIAKHMRYFKLEHHLINFGLADDFEKLISDVKVMISKKTQEKSIYSKLKRIDYRFLVLEYDNIHNYEYITCYVFNKVEQYNKQKLEE